MINIFGQSLWLAARYQFDDETKEHRKLTEIMNYAKGQMTYFKMKKKITEAI